MRDSNTICVPSLSNWIKHIVQNSHSFQKDNARALTAGVSTEYFATTKTRAHRPYHRPCNHICHPMNTLVSVTQIYNLGKLEIDFEQQWDEVPDNITIIEMHLFNEETVIGFCCHHWWSYTLLILHLDPFSCIQSEHFWWVHFCRFL